MNSDKKSNTLDEMAKKAVLDAARGEWQKSFANEVKTLISKLDTVIKDYEDKHDDLHEGWRKQKPKIESLRKSIIGVYPNWRDLIRDGVCSVGNIIGDQKKQVGNLRGCNEGKRDDAKAELDKAKAELDGWQKIVELLTKQLADNDKLIDMIDKLPPGSDQMSLYFFWFRLLPAYAGMRPENVSVYDDETPERLCPAVVSGSSEEDTEEASGIYGLTRGESDTSQQDCTPQQASRRVPWLIDWKKLRDTINKAGEAYQEAGKKYAEANSPLTKSGLADSLRA
jgi:hypothetical protein